MDSGADSGNFHVESEDEANSAESWGEPEPYGHHLNSEFSYA